MLSQLLLPIALCGGPLLAFTIQLRAYLRDKAIKRSGVKTEAQILERGYVVEQLEGQEYLQTSKTRRVTTVSFEANGQPLVFEEDLGRAGEALELGAKAPLWFLPEDPARHVLGNGTTLKSLLGVFFLGLPSFLMGIWIAVG